MKTYHKAAITDAPKNYSIRKRSMYWVYYRRQHAPNSIHNQIFNYKILSAVITCIKGAK